MGDIAFSFAWTLLNTLLILLGVLVPFGIWQGIEEVYGGRQD